MDDNNQQEPASHLSSQTSSCGSPRRRNAPLDLDTALYLQSQASYVQEPNRSGSHSAPSGAKSTQPIKNDTLNNTQQQRNPFNQVTAFDYSNNTTQINNNNKLFQHYYNRTNNNISVDYIDCVSNEDLNPPMKGIPRCKKHLRFHRNSVKPVAAIEEIKQTVPINVISTNTSRNSPTRISASGDGGGGGGDDGIRSACQSDLRFRVQSHLPRLTTINDNQSDDILDGFSNNNLIDNGAENQAIANEPAAANCSSVLYPISVSEVKNRTYFIGSVAQDSLLGQDELYRYFPNGKVNMFVCTWNQNRKRAPMNLNDLLLPDQLVYMPDIYAIGIQEAFSSQADYLRGWEIELQTTLGPSHVLLHSSSLGVLHLALFVRRDLIWFCSTPEESVYNSRSMPTNMIKTKGAVSIAFRFFGTSFMFINCHFPAHENKLKDRIDEYQRIINSIDLPKNLKLLKPRYLSNDSTARFDCVFFMGDLNFRLEQRTFEETVQILEDIFQQKEPSYEALTQNDELLKVMETDQAFHGFDESQIKFPPTYKFLAQTNKYDRQTRRVPSYTDRILFRSKRQRHIQCLIYDWLPQLVSSDHKPVYCLFDVLVRPGHEQNMVTSLNAGLFQRTIYLEALKRRSENPDSMRENEAVGSLICSIS